MFIPIRIYAMGVTLWSCMCNCIEDKYLQGGSVGCYFFQSGNNKYDIHTHIQFSVTQE